MDPAALTRRRAADPRRRTGPVRAHLHRRRHLRRRAVLRAQYDPAVHGRHRSGRTEAGRVHRDRPGDRRSIATDPQRRPRPRRTHPGGARSPARQERRPDRGNHVRDTGGASMTGNQAPALRDVTLRDGLQLTGKVLTTGRKLEIARRLLELGVPTLEIGSMARPDLVPPMANTLEVISELTPEELERCWVWVATPRHIEKAATAGATNFQYCFSASNSHNRANIGRTTEDSLAPMPAAVELTRAVGGRIQLCIATSFTCPFEGPIPEQRVLDIAGDPRTDGAADIVLADTLGQAVPTQVSALVSRVRA